MSDAVASADLAILVVGAVVLLARIVRAGLQRLQVPSLVGYIGIGLALSLVDDAVGIVTAEVRSAIELLAAAGVVLLLFRTGLESNPSKLVEQLPRAGLALIGSAVPSAVLGYVACRHLLGTELLPALFVAVALSATSVGVAVGIWRDLGLIDSDGGALLVDLAELDDVAAVILLSLLLAFAMHLNGTAAAFEVGTGGWLVGATLLKLLTFAALCLLFARLVERHLTSWLARIEEGHIPVIAVAGIGFVIAALAGWLGLSLAIGGLLAGLAFSRDPGRVRIDNAFETLSQFFVPFFFVGIGLRVEPDALPGAIGAGALLLGVAILGKIAGTALAVIPGTGARTGLAIAVSMVPRAEIAMIVVERGHTLGAWAVPPTILAAMVVVTLGTCLLSPPLVRFLLRRHVPGRRAPGD